MKSNHFSESISEFIKDTEYFGDYDKYVPKDHHTVVRLFLYKEPVLQKGSLILPKLTLGSTEKSYNTGDYNEVVMPFAVVIKGGGYSPGDLVTVNSKDVQGVKTNPAYTYYLSSLQNVQGGKPVLPEGLRPQISSLEMNWSQYLIPSPTRAAPTKEDLLTYSVPTSKLTGKWEI